MPRLSRRALLAASASLPAFTPAFAAYPRYVTPVDVVIGSGPPVAPVRPVDEIYWGQAVTDRYRWMESEDAEWQAYVRAEGAYTAQVLDKVPGRAALAAAIGKNTQAVAVLVAIQTGGTKIFTELRPAGANTSKLYVREGLTGADTLLIDPDKFAASGTHDALDWWAPSPDGSKVVYGLSAGGSERSVMHLLDVASGQVSPLSIDRTEEASPSWLPDGSGFFYNRFQNVPPDDVHYEEDSSAWLHRLADDPAKDTRLLGPDLTNGIPLQPIDSPMLVATPGADFVLALIISGVQNEIALYLAPLASVAAGKPAWTPICAPADDVTSFAVHGSDIYLLTHKNAPRYRIVKVTAAQPHVAGAVEVVPQSRAVIREIVAARDGLYILDLDAGLGGLRRLAPGGTATPIPLPFDGAIDQDSFYANPLQDGAWFLLEGWVRPCVACQARPDGSVTQTGLSPRPDIDVSPYVSEEVIVPARDGARIPLSIIYRKGLKRDGTAPLLLEAYGAYGITLDPAFLARWLPLLDLGGVFAVGHVRGGGELGEDWHKDGQKATKYHTWQDTEDCALYLIAKNYCAHRTLGVVGGSAGGITVGRLLTERPGLAAVVISMVGVSDAMRSEFSPNGPPNIPEFGSVKTEQGFHDLFAMDAYQHVHDGVKYPSVLLTTGLHDPRVSSWEPTKMTARLQAATASKNPVLLRVDLDAGHGIGSTRAQRDAETADLMAFLLWRTGNPAYQPRA